MHPMTSFGKFTIRFAAYGIILGYLACDLFVFHGPLYKRAQANKPDSAESIADAKRRGVAAVVYGREITLAQIDHAVRLRLSQNPTISLTNDQLRLHRYAALAELIDHELLRVKAMHSTSELPVEDAEIDAAIARITARFPDEAAFHNAIAQSGHTVDTLRAQIAARIQQRKYIDLRIDPLAPPDDASARHHAAQNFRDTLRIYESRRDRIHIRHNMLRGDATQPE